MSLLIHHAIALAILLIAMRFNQRIAPAVLTGVSLFALGWAVYQGGWTDVYKTGRARLKVLWPD